MDCKLNNQSAPIYISVREHRQKIFEFLNDIWPLTSVLPSWRPSIFEVVLKTIENAHSTRKGTLMQI